MVLRQPGLAPDAVAFCFYLRDTPIGWGIRVRGTPWRPYGPPVTIARMHIGQAIKKKRQEKSATQEEVAFRAGTDASNLSRMERGLQKPSLEMLEQIARALDVTVSDLYAQVENSQSRSQTRETAPTPYAPSSRQLQRLFAGLSPEHQRLALEFVRLLGKMQKQG